MKQTCKYILAMVVVFCVISSNKEINVKAAEDNWLNYAASSFTYGDGSANNPYQIDTAEELALLAKVVNRKDSKYVDKCYVLTADIDLAGHKWTPIGAIKDNESSYIGFKGVFDGGNYCISNMSVGYKKGYYQFGLFGWNLGEIRNIHLKDAKIVIKSVCEGWQAENGMGSSFSIGGIAGENCGEKNTIIKNCIVENISIDAKATMSLSCGGLVGNLNYGTIESCKVTGNIKATSGRAIWVGGAIGDISNEIIVSDCGFEGSVTSENDGTLEFPHLVEQGYSYLNYAGGFCGSMGRANEDLIIEDCYCYATVKAKSESIMPDAGGFSGALGVLYGDIVFSNLYCNASVTTQKEDKVSKQTDFVNGECGLHSQGYVDSLVYKNLININDGKVEVYSNSDKGNITSNTYSLAQIDLLTFFANLGFGSDNWTFSSEHFPVLKCEMVPKIKMPVIKSVTSNNSSVTIQWNKISNATGYRIYRKEGKDKWKQIATVSSNGKLSYTDVNVSKDKKYIYGVQAYLGNVTSGNMFASRKIAFIDDANITLSKNSYTYNGNSKKPSVKVKIGSEILEKGTDYTVSYKNNKNIGRATVIITGRGNYTGTIKKTFKINATKGTVYTVGEYKYKITDSSTVAFAGIKSNSIKKVVIAKKVTIGGKSFKVTSIANEALYKKTKVTRIIIGSNVKMIGKKAFSGCKLLKSVTIPSNVMSVGKEAFENCSRLSDITIESTKIKTVGKNAFKNIKSTAKIKVPSKKYSSYKKLLQGKGQGSKVTIKKIQRNSKH